MKAALRDAVTERWLARVAAPLDAVLTEEGTASQRLRHRLELLIAAKRSKVLDDPELFATYHELTTEARAVVKVHVDHLVSQVAQIVADGAAQGEFAAPDPAATARAILSATSSFHNPAHSAEWLDPEIDTAFANV